MGIGTCSCHEQKSYKSYQYFVSCLHLFVILRTRMRFVFVLVSLIRHCNSGLIVARTALSISTE